MQIQVLSAATLTCGNKLKSGQIRNELVLILLLLLKKVDIFSISSASSSTGIKKAVITTAFHFISYKLVIMV